MVRLTVHAQKRMQQRGIRRSAIDLVIEHGDQRITRPNQAVSVRISKRKLRKLAQKKAIEPQICSRLQGIIVLQARENGSVISAFHHQGRQGRPY